MHNSRYTYIMLWVTLLGCYKYRHAGRAGPIVSQEVSGDAGVGDARSGALRGLRRAVWVVGPDQILIVAVYGVGERCLIVQRDGGHDVVVDVETAFQQRFMIADEPHPR